jgi:hypothetical protein
MLDFRPFRSYAARAETALLGLEGTCLEQSSRDLVSYNPPEINSWTFKERAVELYALAESQPFVANSQLFEDIAGKHVAATAATLPADVVEAAQTRGRARDWWETAEELLAELRALGWAGSQ